MKITDKDRAVKAMEMIQEISTYAQSLNPKRDWQQSHDAVCNIYRIIHSILAPKCRPSHPKWCRQIDDAIKAERKKFRGNK